MAVEISPVLHEIIVAVSRKAVDERMEEFAVTRRDFDEVKMALRDLVAAQVRTEQRVGGLESAVQRLTEAQARTEQRMEELAAAQARTEQRVEGLEAAVQRLTEAQARTEQRMEELAAAQARTEQRVGGLEAAVQRLTEAQARTDQRMEELAAAQARTEQRVGGLEAAVQRLTEAQARTEQRMEELAAAQARTEQRMEELAAAQARTEQRMEELAAAQARTEQRMEELAAALERLDVRVSDLKGWQVELRYQERAVAYFGPLLRRMRVVFPNEMEDELEVCLSREEFQDLLRLDLLVSGLPRYRPEAPQVWLAVEASAVVDRHDVERARRRAAALRRAGYRAIPTVAGEQATPGAEEEARTHKMLLLRDGQALFWEEALEEALSG